MTKCWLTDCDRTWLTSCVREAAYLADAGLVQGAAARRHMALELVVVHELREQAR